MKRAMLWVARETAGHNDEDTVAFYTSPPTLDAEKCGECGREKSVEAFAAKDWIAGSTMFYDEWLKATKIKLSNMEAVKISIGVEP